MQGVPSGRGLILDLEVAGRAKSFAHVSWSRKASGQAHSTSHLTVFVVSELAVVFPNTIFMRNLAASSALEPLVRRDIRFVGRGACRAEATSSGSMPSQFSGVGFDAAWWWERLLSPFTARLPSNREVQACELGLCAQKPKQDPCGRRVRVPSTV